MSAQVAQSSQAPRPLHVLIIGGGIGGLCLAHGLKQAGISVALYECDPSSGARTQGYRIRINPMGSRALAACLPPHLYDALVASCGRTPTAFTFITEQLDEVLSVRERRTSATPDPIESHKSAHRQALRRILLQGLDEIVHFDRTFARYELTPEGKVTAFFTDGSQAVGDVLVGADGVHSRARAQLLPQAQHLDTGIRSIGSAIPLTDEVRALLPQTLADGPANVLAPSGRSMFIAYQQFQQPARDAELLSAVAAGDAENERDYLLWAFSARKETFPGADDLDQCDGQALRDRTLALVSRWHPHLQEIVRRSDPAIVTLLRIRTSVPVPPWPTTQVTVLGDAIHSMTPARGIGGNTALRDAALLRDRLAAVQRGEQSLLPAIQEYETAMRAYGFAAVRSSLLAQEQAVADDPTALRRTKATFRVLNLLPPLKRHVFRNI